METQLTNTEYKEPEALTAEVAYKFEARIIEVIKRIKQLPENITFKEVDNLFNDINMIESDSHVYRHQELKKYFSMPYLLLGYSRRLVEARLTIITEEYLKDKI